MLAERNPEIGRAVVKLRKMSADEKARDLYERRINAKRDVAMYVDDKAFEIAKNFLIMGMPIEQISKGTGLSPDEIEKLK